MESNTTVLEGFLSPSLLKNFLPQAQKISSIASVVSKAKPIANQLKTFQSNIRTPLKQISSSARNISRNISSGARNISRDISYAAKNILKNPQTREFLQNTLSAAADSYVPGSGEFIRSIPLQNQENSDNGQTSDLSELTEKAKQKHQSVTNENSNSDDFYNYLINGYVYTDTVEKKAKEEFFKKYPPAFILQKLNIKNDPKAPKTAAEVEKGIVEFFDLEKNKKTGKYEPKKKTISEIIKDIDPRPVSKKEDKDHSITDHINPFVKTPDDNLFDHVAIPVIVLLVIMFYLNKK